MSVQKPNIRQIIKSQPKFISSSKGNKTGKNESLFNPSSAIFSMVQAGIEKLTPIQKLGIGAIVYIILSGILSNLYLIYKLITLFF